MFSHSTQKEEVFSFHTIVSKHRISFSSNKANHHNVPMPPNQRLNDAIRLSLTNTIDDNLPMQAALTTMKNILTILMTETMPITNIQNIAFRVSEAPYTPKLPNTCIA